MWLWTYGVLMTSLSHCPLKSSSGGCSVIYSPSNSSFRATSFSRLNITNGTCQSNVLQRSLVSLINKYGVKLVKLKQHILVSSVLNCQFFCGFKIYFMFIWYRGPGDFILNLQKWELKLYLEAAVTDNTTEGDDCVCYSQEMERRLHVSTAFL